MANETNDGGGNPPSGGGDGNLFPADIAPAQPASPPPAPRRQLTIDGKVFGEDWEAALYILLCGNVDLRTFVSKVLKTRRMIEVSPRAIKGSEYWKFLLCRDRGLDMLAQWYGQQPDVTTPQLQQQQQPLLPVAAIAQPQTPGGMPSTASQIQAQQQFLTKTPLPTAELTRPSVATAAPVTRPGTMGRPSIGTAGVPSVTPNANFITPRPIAGSVLPNPSLLQQQQNLILSSLASLAPGMTQLLTEAGIAVPTATALSVLQPTLVAAAAAAASQRASSLPSGGSSALPPLINQATAMPVRDSSWNHTPPLRGSSNHPPSEKSGPPSRSERPRQPSVDSSASSSAAESQIAARRQWTVATQNSTRINPPAAAAATTSVNYADGSLVKGETSPNISRPHSPIPHNVNQLQPPQRKDGLASSDGDGEIRVGQQSTTETRRRLSPIDRNGPEILLDEEEEKASSARKYRKISHPPADDDSAIRSRNEPELKPSAVAVKPGADPTPAADTIPLTKSTAQAHAASGVAATTVHQSPSNLSSLTSPATTTTTFDRLDPTCQDRTVCAVCGRRAHKIPQNKNISSPRRYVYYYCRTLACATRQENGHPVGRYVGWAFEDNPYFQRPSSTGNAASILSPASTAKQLPSVKQQSPAISSLPATANQEFPNESDSQKINREPEGSNGAENNNIVQTGSGSTNKPVAASRSSSSTGASPPGASSRMNSTGQSQVDMSAAFDQCSGDQLLHELEVRWPHLRNLNSCRHCGASPGSTILKDQVKVHWCTNGKCPSRQSSVPLEAMIGWEATAR